ncbi:BREX-1 system adenine-specific DNA-methyltransferase PglX [Klebsiella michiganensis]|uniref:BREX-1 system adenine-specific DNA-methyltransferase PglX n=2 Tax=Klebsiella michiganensis TaxID=1134687 RepID=UPI002247A529|nr:BREX-1 system adenine-specific DNA-methyltransferase PglX [Klebsiella michiganensis]MCW9490327.1 BREX-1 system adenine-specific DNA-methyltransferase PglX [Klebsiella michiganensis]
MNTNNIKKYAPQARNQFRDAVIQKLTTLGISVDKKGTLQIADAEIVGETVRYGQFDYPKSTLTRRDRLVKRAREQGFDVLVEHCAYTWFNRLCAIRYMEIQGYLDHGFRMLSHPDNPTGFEVLDHVPEVAEALLPEKKALLVEMKLSGNQDEAIYRELLLAQCHALHRAMPFLFEAVDDEAELLLPDNLTRTDSVLRGLVDGIPEEDWQEVEVIGWLYQFYISEKKDAVIGKVVKSEDIPAATQLFTPNWIVQYLVQNSVGRQWLQTYPDSPLKGKMDYYIEPAEQTPEVQAQLAAITPASIEPESIKVLDPACGSGHILIEAYNVLKNIYEERGYRARDIPQLILENNIFGLDIDDRAAQLSGFALLMMARQDDRRIFTRDVRLNIVSLQESLHLDIAKLWQQLNFHQQNQTGSMGDMFAENTSLPHTDSAEYQLLMRTLKRFLNAKTLGSLIQVPQEEEAELKAFLDTLYRLDQEGDSQQKAAAKAFIPYIQQAWILAQRYDAVVANPPYMGSGYYNDALKSYINEYFLESKADLYTVFMSKCLSISNSSGFVAMITIPNWMFLNAFEKVRLNIIKKGCIINLIHNGRGVWGSDFGSCAFILKNAPLECYKGLYKKLFSKNGSISTNKVLNDNFFKNKNYSISLSKFSSIPGQPISYWENEEFLSKFSSNKKLSDYLFSDGLLKTGNNEKYVRYHWEVSAVEIANKNYKFMSKGGDGRDFYGNTDHVVKWDIFSREHYRKDKVARITPEYLWEKEAITWSKLTVGKNTFRYLPHSHIAETVGPCLYPKDNVDLKDIILYLSTNIASKFMAIINPTVSLQSGDVLSIPYISADVGEIAEELIKIHKCDWNSSETAYEFNYLETIKKIGINRLSNVLPELLHNNKKITQQAIELKTKANKIYSQLFGIHDDELSHVSIESITLLANPHHVYSGEDKEYRQVSDIISRFISYSIGCMMGRYSLDREGLVYAHEDNKGFAELVAEGAYKTFPADNDGILPLMDDEWFDDDVTSRVKEFVRTVWGEEHLQENLDFIAESLCLYAIKPKKGESALDTIRRYLSTQFWKDHMKMYKKRPIYWLFSSGKEKAFECLVYLHRYNDATLARMRTEYVVPLLARYQANIDRLNEQVDGASGGESARLKRGRDNLSKKFNELRSFDDRLRHYADMRISIDLNDGVKVNYGKFGDLLADVKAITGNAPEVM